MSISPTGRNNPSGTTRPTSSASNPYKRVRRQPAGFIEGDGSDDDICNRSPKGPARRYCKSRTL